MNWIEEALDEIGNSAIGDRERWKQIILSHAPVIDRDELMLSLIDVVNEEIVRFNEEQPDHTLTSLGGVLQRKFKPLLHAKSVTKHKE